MKKIIVSFLCIMPFLSHAQKTGDYVRIFNVQGVLNANLDYVFQPTEEEQKTILAAVGEKEYKTIMKKMGKSLPDGIRCAYRDRTEMCVTTVADMKAQIIAQFNGKSLVRIAEKENPRVTKYYNGGSDMYFLMESDEYYMLDYWKYQTVPQPTNAQVAVVYKTNRTRVKLKSGYFTEGYMFTSKETLKAKFGEESAKINVRPYFFQYNFSYNSRKLLYKDYSYREYIAKNAVAYLLEEFDGKCLVHIPMKANFHFPKWHLPSSGDGEDLYLILSKNDVVTYTE
ncbi:MAG: hypothetical protein U0T11_06835 [Chitinophagaceae bacterium]